MEVKVGVWFEHCRNDLGGKFFGITNFLIMEKITHIKGIESRNICVPVSVPICDDDDNSKKSNVAKKLLNLVSALYKAMNK